MLNHILVIYDSLKGLHCINVNSLIKYIVVLFILRRVRDIVRLCDQRLQLSPLCAITLNLQEYIAYITCILYTYMYITCIMYTYMYVYNYNAIYMSTQCLKSGNMHKHEQQRTTAYSFMYFSKCCN